MTRFNTISAHALMRLIGTPRSPRVIDVTLDEDFADNPFLIPTAQRFPHDDLQQLAPALSGQSVVTVCQKGLKLSQGAAALLRTLGIPAETLEGGNLGWQELGLPRVPATSLPAPGRGTLWVTRHRPRIDRIACPWLIRRFVDPQARFLFVSPSEVQGVADRFGATAFDVPGAPWTHIGSACTFDSMVAGFGLSTEPLERLAQIVRGADTDRPDLAPECAGLLALSVGLSRTFSRDLEQLEAGLPLYDALYRWARDGQNEVHNSAQVAS
ncbi:sulfurtransferase/chromate resistance protein [uncultured Roseobacter sp.]|uniref:sulfurtransferase/chromate resistance protein n=1 Tax=uncultured Roseobacter sp. TaxID=114847 RepID=UPI002619AECF|nr:sulfurtransferase/chromate resistance protein [uncultured Roseobacter sp.]